MKITFKINIVTFTVILFYNRYVARDLGGSDPERMAPPRVMEYVQTLFAKSSISVQVIEGHDNFEREYPLMAAVNRAARCELNEIQVWVMETLMGGSNKLLIAYFAKTLVVDFCWSFMLTSLKLS